tara:strand:- start:128 stop:403 length:276 start_codon:yes stop_codon:yes gene_type:complete
MNKKQKIWQSYIPGAALGAKVVNTKTKDRNGKTRETADIGFAIRFWKRSLKDAGTLFEYKSRKEYIKKSQRKREQLNAAKFAQWVKDKNQD